MWLSSAHCQAQRSSLNHPDNISRPDTGNTTWLVDTSRSQSLSEVSRGGSEVNSVQLTIIIFLILFYLFTYFALQEFLNFLYSFTFQIPNVGSIFPRLPGINTVPRQFCNHTLITVSAQIFDLQQCLEFFLSSISLIPFIFFIFILRNQFFQYH